jgi:hypothetical protein
MSQSTATKREMVADKRETVVGKRMSSPNKRKSASKNARQRRKKSKRRRTASPEQTDEKRLLFELFGWDSDTAEMSQEDNKLCLICVKKFSTSSYRYVHERVVHGKQQKHNCEECEKAYSTRSNLNSHIQNVHVKSKPFVCKICSKYFGRKGDLKVHIHVVHEGRRDYLCQECGARSMTRHNLQTHIDAVHSKLKPYSCKHCPKKFATKSDLTKHIRVHTGEQPYPCRECDRRFSQVGSRNRHQLTHEKAGKVACPYSDGCSIEQGSNGIPCELSFKDDEELASHVKLAHTVEGLAAMTHSTEQAMADFFDENSIAYSRDHENTVSHRACAEMKIDTHRSRPDFFLPALSAEVGYHVLIGNDEAAHRRYPCDFKRTIELNTALCQGSVGPTGEIVYIRVNPSPYRIDSVRHEPSLDQVHAKLLDLLKALPTMNLLHSLNLIYIGYDQTTQPDLEPWQRLSCFTSAKEINRTNAEILSECVLLVL